MGILKKLLGNKNNDRVRLISAVKKLDSGVNGVFVRIHNDLATYIADAGENENALRKMAYAYARRASGAGLFLQGVCGKEDYAYTFTMFKKFQQITQLDERIESGSQQSVKFQNEAAKQAAELLKSYNSRLSFEFISFMLSAVESGDVPNRDMVLTDDFVLMWIEKAMNQ